MAASAGDVMSYMADAVAPNILSDPPALYRNILSTGAGRVAASLSPPRIRTPSVSGKKFSKTLALPVCEAAVFSLVTHPSVGATNDLLRDLAALLPLTAGLRRIGLTA